MASVIIARRTSPCAISRSDPRRYDPRVAELVPDGATLAVDWAYVPSLDPRRHHTTSIEGDLATLRRAGVEWVVLSSYAFNRLFARPDENAARVGLVLALESGQWPQVRWTGLPPGRAYTYQKLNPPGDRDHRLVQGPEIRIYRVDDGSLTDGCGRGRRCDFGSEPLLHGCAPDVAVAASGAGLR